MVEDFLKKITINIIIIFLTKL